MENKENSFTSDFLKVIISLIAIFISCNYFFTYRILKGILSYYKLSTSAVLVKEDFMFSFGHLNFKMILLSLLGFIWIYIWGFFPSSEKKELISSLKNIIQRIKTQKKRLLIVLLSSLLVGIIIWFIIIDFEKESTTLLILYLIIFCLFPALYIFIVNKRRLIMIGYLTSAFLWCNIFIDNVLKTTNEKPITSSNVEIAIQYKKDYIKTSDSLRLVFNGHKYIILADKNNLPTLIPANEVGVISYTKKEYIQTP